MRKTQMYRKSRVNNIISHDVAIAKMYRYYKIKLIYYRLVYGHNKLEENNNKSLCSQQRGSGNEMSSAAADACCLLA